MMLLTVEVSLRVLFDKNSIRLGEPLSCDLFNESGSRVFREGFIFRNQKSLERIQHMQLYIQQDDTENDVKHEELPEQQRAMGTKQVSVQGSVPGTVQSPVQNPVQEFDQETVQVARHREVIYEFPESRNERHRKVGDHVFHFLDHCIASEAEICKKIFAGATDQAPALTQLVGDLVRLFASAPDASLAAVHLDYSHPLCAVRPTYAAILSLSVAEALSLPPANRRSLVGAALTTYLGMYKYCEQVLNHEGPMAEDERAYLAACPGESHKFLLANSVTDQLMLDIVLEHRFPVTDDAGNGGVAYKTSSQEAAILKVAEEYLSMIIPRRFRKPLLPKAALQKLYKDAIARDDSIAINLIKQLGIYPPGSLVRLANQEIAIVVQRNPKMTVAPEVAAIADSQGRVYQEYIFRSSMSPVYKIVDTYQPETPIRVDMNSLWQETVEGLWNENSRSGA